MMRRSTKLSLPNDPFGRTFIYSCFLEPRGGNVFECSNMAWNVPVNMDASILIFDPQPGASPQSMGSRALFVNNQRIKRVSAGANGINGTFRLMTNGTLR